MYQSGELYAYKNIVHLLSDKLDYKTTDYMAVK